MHSLRDWFTKPSAPSPRRARRRAARGFAADHGSGPALKQDEITNISATGVYLRTEERWPPGTMVSLNLHRVGPSEEGTERSLRLQAKAVRWGDDGVGLAFILPGNMDSRQWVSLLESSAEAEPEDIVEQFRMAQAIAFIVRICPPAEEDVRRLLRGGMSNYRVASAVEIALKTERLVAGWPDADALRALPRIAVRILQDGSWAAEERLQQSWAGLLATSCTADGQDESNFVYVDLFSQLAAIHTRIFNTACARATKVVSETGAVSARMLSCSTEEIMQITGSRDLLHIERDLEHMAGLGLLEPRDKSTSFLPIDHADITPSSLALQLFARCHAYRGTPQEFFGLVPSATSVSA